MSIGYYTYNYIQKALLFKFALPGPGPGKANLIPHACAVLRTGIQSQKIINVYLINNPRQPEEVPVSDHSLVFIGY